MSNSSQMYTPPRTMPKSLILVDNNGCRYKILSEVSYSNLGVVFRVRPESGRCTQYDIAWFDFYAKVLLPAAQMQFTEAELNALHDNFVATAEMDQQIRHEALVPIIAGGTTQSSEALWEGKPFRISMSPRGRSLCRIDALIEDFKSHRPLLSTRVRWMEMICDVTRFLIEKEHPRWNLTASNLYVADDGRIFIADVGGIGWSSFSDLALWNYRHSNAIDEHRANLLSSETVSSSHLSQCTNQLQITFATICQWWAHDRYSLENPEESLGRYSDLSIPDFHIPEESQTSEISIGKKFEECLKSLSILKEFAEQAEGVNFENLERVRLQLDAWSKQQVTHHANDLEFRSPNSINDIDVMDELNKMLEGAVMWDHVEWEDPDSAFPTDRLSLRDSCQNCQSRLLYELQLPSEVAAEYDWTPVFVCFGRPGQPCGHILNIDRVN